MRSVFRVYVRCCISNIAREALLLFGGTFRAHVQVLFLRFVSDQGVSNGLRVSRMVPNLWTQVACEVAVDVYRSEVNRVGIRGIAHDVRRRCNFSESFGYTFPG
jgi:hypothetical protein